MSSDQETTISAHSLSKAYLLWDSPRDRLRQPVRDRLSRWLHVPHRQYYQQFWALRGIDFDVQRGETLGVIGRNGCGKSTLLQILAGTLTPTEGSHVVLGRISALLELGSGFNPEFTGSENVYLSAAILGLTRAEIEARYQSIVDFADIGEFIDQPVRLYSSGMFVRLAFAVAICVEPDVLIVDEALAVGDVFFVQKCMRFMRRFKQENTILFVSHNTDAVLSLCDRALLLEAGEMKALGTAKDVCELYRREYYGAQQDVDGVEALAEAPPRHAEALAAGKDLDLVDQRLKYLNTTQFRNDIELCSFDADAEGFGAGGGRIANVGLVDPATGAPLSWVVGGERVRLQVTAVAERQIQQPIIGFLVKDHLGQALFGDNTYLSHRADGEPVAAGMVVRAAFSFRMPVLPAGDYVVLASIADGTQTEHVQLHWASEALQFHSHTSSVCTGLVGVPMQSIELERIEGGRQ